jgi:hypothetical protein
MKDLEILKRLIAEAEEESVETTVDSETTQVKEKPKNAAFEKDPMGFILKKYHTLNEIMTELMTKDFREFVDAIFYIAPKPTTFKIQLHNGQSFFMTYMKENIYEAIISGKRYYLAGIGEKERCMMAIARLLRFGTPLKTKGAEGAEEGTRDGDNTGMEGDWAANGGATGGIAPETGEIEASAEAGGEELTENIVILKKLLTEAEGEQKKSVLFETALVIAWYKINKRKIPSDAISSSEVELINKKYPDLINKAKKALIDTGLTGGDYAKSTGKLTEPLTEFWKSYGATNKTSKSDVIIGGVQISVKAGPSQLMSGVKEEAKATFYAALQKTPELINSKEVINILSQIEKFAKSGRTSGNIRTSLKKGNDKALNIANAANKEAMAALQNLFDTNPDFAEAFAIEAMSGEMKFGPDSPATAKYILYVDKNYDNAALNKIKKKSYAKKIASQMKIDVRFKTGSIKSKGEKTGDYGYATVLGIQSDPEKAEKQIKEGTFDSITSFFKDTWRKIKTSISSLLNFFIGNPNNVDVNVEDSNIDFS